MLESKEFIKAVEDLGLEVRRLNDKIIRLDSSIGRWVVSPAEAMHLLVAELRALRYLLDQNGDFKAVDKLHAAYNLAVEEAKLAQEEASRKEKAAAGERGVPCPGGGGPQKDDE